MSFVLGAKQTVQTFTLEKGAEGCAPKGSNLACTITVSLPAGRYVSTVYVYDQAPVDGGFESGAHVLSEICCEGLGYTIKSGKTTTILPKVEGNDVSLAIANLPQGCITNSFGPTAFTVSAFDADGYTIAGTYEEFIVLSDSDKSGDTTIATSGPDNPPPDELLSSFDTSTIAWNGDELAGGTATITALITTQQSASATLWAGPGDVVFNYTGSPQYQTVSPCANSSVTVWLWGAAGGSASYDNYGTADGGYGGLVIATIPATTGQQFEVIVGGVGSQGQVNGSGTGGYNGGGSGQPYPSGCIGGTCVSGGGGGGATDIRQGGTALSNRVLVAGGGGGANALSTISVGGSGGGLTGGSGGPSGSSYCLTYYPIVPGGGGTQTAGGYGAYGNSGTFGSGGPGVGDCEPGFIGFGSGGGGGGWYGGGGGYSGGGGGGGSGYAESSATKVLMDTGFNSGPGIAEICWPQSSNCKVTAIKLKHAKKR